MLKSLLLIAIIMGIFTVVSILIPDQITSSIDNSIIYFLNYLWNLNTFIDVSVLMSCLNILASFYLGIGLFFVLYSLINSVK